MTYGINNTQWAKWMILNLRQTVFIAEEMSNGFTQDIHKRKSTYTSANFATNELVLFIFSRHNFSAFYRIEVFKKIVHQTLYLIHYVLMDVTSKVSNRTLSLSFIFIKVNVTDFYFWIDCFLNVLWQWGFQLVLKCHITEFTEYSCTICTLQRSQCYK